MLRGNLTTERWVILAIRQQLPGTWFQLPRWHRVCREIYLVSALEYRELQNWHPSRKQFAMPVVTYICLSQCYQQKI
jgi:hypothetical protein